MTTELVAVQEPVVAPAIQVQAAREKAALLQDIVNQAGLALSLGGPKKHLQYEAWQTIGAFHGCTAEIQWTKRIMHEDRLVGYEAKAVIINPDGRIISSAEAECTKGERNWKDKPSFQLRSMAQTRAAAKAFRMVFSWVIALAGYSPTPYEELNGDEGKELKERTETWDKDEFNKMDAKQPAPDGPPTKELKQKLHKALQEYGLNAQQIKQFAELNHLNTCTHSNMQAIHDELPTLLEEYAPTEVKI